MSVSVQATTAVSHLAHTHALDPDPRRGERRAPFKVSALGEIFWIFRPGIGVSICALEMFLNVAGVGWL